MPPRLALDLREVQSVQINISTRHGHLSDASQDKITNKAEKLARIFDRITSIRVTIDLSDQDNPCVDIGVSAEHKREFVASDRSNNLMSSVDSAVHKLEQQLRKYKEKVQERHRHPEARHQTMPVEPEAEADDV